MIELPPSGAGLDVVASVSGGKDSTALILALRESEIAARFVFADTGWEAPGTYAYLDLLRQRLGIEIDVVRASSKPIPESLFAALVEAGFDPDDAEDRPIFHGAMVSRIAQRAGFPARMQRWCTRELKLEPLREYHDAIEAAGGETINAMGVRGAESDARAKMPVWEDSDEWGGWVWRPLLDWTVEDVLMTHRRHGIPVNPLYQDGHDRVGCDPCIYARKEEIRLTAQNRQRRIVVIRVLERWATEERVRRNEAKPDRYGHPIATFFQTRNGRRVRVCKTDHAHGDGSACVLVRTLIESTPMDIDQIVAWSQTEAGGKQTSFLLPRPSGGCMRWGLCETGAASADDESEGL